MTPRRRPSPVGLALALTLLAAPLLSQDDGDLDPRWGAAGIARIQRADFLPRAVGCAPSGRCYLGAEHPGGEFHIRSITAAGAFDDEAYAVFDLGGTQVDAPYDLALGADGRPALAGTARDATDDQFAAARFIDAALFELDDTFGGDGMATLNFNGDTEVHGVAVGPSGEVVAVGCYQTGGADGLDFAVVRFLANGLPDNDFDGNGVRTIGFNLANGTDDDCASAVAILPDGTIVVAGYAQHNLDDRDFAIARLTVTGALDLTFNGTGKQTVAFDLGGPDTDEASDVAVDRFGRVVLAGRATGASFYRPVLARLTAGGAPDASFDGEGDDVAKFVGDDGALAQVVGVELASYPSDRIFFLTKDRLLWALTETGGYDSTFDDEGALLVTDPAASSNGAPIDLSLLGGMPVVLGESTHTATPYEIVARYWVDQIFGDDFEGGNTNAWRGW